jgi:hypothetical protein
MVDALAFVLAYSPQSGSIRENSWREGGPKINAAQASHLGRIARECDASRFRRVKRRIVNQETALAKERTFTGTPCRQSIREY